MSLKQNIIASYASQIYVTLLSILILPVYLRYLGTEAYGLIGFFAVLQMWFNLLDMGLSPTLSRETARFRGGALPAWDYRQLLLATSIIFWTLGLLGGAVLFGLSGYIAAHWLNVRALPMESVHQAVGLMAWTIALRWVGGLYRGLVTGTEQLVWLGGFNIIIGTVRFLGILAVFHWQGASLAIFFTYQLLVSGIELLVLMAKARQTLPALPAGRPLAWSPQALVTAIRPVLKFSLHMSFLTLVWIMVTQADKLALSSLLPLDDYGRFSIAVMVASGVTLASAPVGNALMLRLSTLQTQNNQDNLVHLYRTATQVMVTLIIPLCWLMGTYPQQILWALTGNAATADLAAPILVLYAAGNGVAGLAAFPYYLQYAKGDLRLHVIGNLLFFVLLIPGIIWTAVHYGAEGAGWVWLIANIFNLLFWPPRVHRRLAGHSLDGWLIKDVLATSKYCIALLLGAALLIHKLDIFSQNRLILSAQLSALAVAALGLSLLSGRHFRQTAFEMLAKPKG